MPADAADSHTRSTAPTGRSLTELVERSSIGQAVAELRADHSLCTVGIDHHISDAAKRAYRLGLIYRTRCMTCGQKLHMERGENPGDWPYEFWRPGW